MHFFGCYSLSYKVFDRVFVLGDLQAIWPELYSECLRPPLSLAYFMLTSVCVCWLGGLIVSHGENYIWEKMFEV